MVHNKKLRMLLVCFALGVSKESDKFGMGKSQSGRRGGMIESWAFDLAPTRIPTTPIRSRWASWECSRRMVEGFGQPRAGGLTVR